MPTPRYFPASIMARAWAFARAGARTFGGRPAAYLAAALRRSWQAARESAERVAARRARVAAELARIAGEAKGWAAPTVRVRAPFRQPFAVGRAA